MAPRTAPTPTPEPAPEPAPAPVSSHAVPPGLGSGAVVATPSGPSVVPVDVVPLGVPLDYPDPEAEGFWHRLPDLVTAPALLAFLPFLDPEAVETPTASGHSLADVLADLDARRVALGDFGEAGLALLDAREEARAASASAGADAILSGVKGKAAPAPFDADAWRLAIRRKADEAGRLVDEARAVVARADALLGMLADTVKVRAALLDRLASTRADGLEAAVRLESAVLTDAHLRGLLDEHDRRLGLRDAHRASVLGRLVGAEVIRNRRRSSGALLGVQADAAAVLTDPASVALLSVWNPALDTRPEVRAADGGDVLAYVRSQVTV